MSDSLLCLCCTDLIALAFVDRDCDGSACRNGRSIGFRINGVEVVTVGITRAVYIIDLDVCKACFLERVCYRSSDVFSFLAVVQAI